MMMMMIEHAWIAIDEDGELYVVRVERRAPLADGEVKLFANGSRTVRPIEDDKVDPRPWQSVGPVAYRIEADRVVRFRPVTDRALAEVQADRLAAVRQEAGDRITEFAPLYRQINATRDLVGADDAAREAAVEMFDRIDAIRSACDAAEGDIMAATTAEEACAIAAFWPE
jgi:hypothetical protein